MIHGAEESDSGCYSCLTKTKVHSLLTHWEPKQLVCVRVMGVQEKREEEQRKEEQERRRKLTLFRIGIQLFERKKERERAEQRKTLGTLFLVVLGMIVIPAFIYCMCLGVSKIKAAGNHSDGLVSLPNPLALSEAENLSSGGLAQQLVETEVTTRAFPPISPSAPS